ncbi:terminase, partial [Klebsiella pneumoniae]|nr:terminase [Klebsiella pneumoniae]
IGEWYGCPPDELNKGLNMSSTNVAKGVAWVDKRLVGDELAGPDEIKLNGVTQGQLNIMPGICKKVTPGPADSAIYNTGDDE